MKDFFYKRISAVFRLSVRQLVVVISLSKRLIDSRLKTFSRAIALLSFPLIDCSLIMLDFGNPFFLFRPSTR